MRIDISLAESGVFAGINQLDDRIHDDSGIASNAKGSFRLKEAVVCFD